jgi:hypothetical protein
VNNEVIFPGPDIDVDGTYRTVFGPVVSVYWHTIRNSRRSVRTGLRRLLSMLKPDIPGYDWWLGERQMFWVRNHKPYRLYLASLYCTHFDEYTTVEQELYDHFDDPHDKKALRIQAVRELRGDGLICAPDADWIPRHRAVWKVKVAEKAKPNKYARGIVDVGVAGSLEGFRLMEYMKQAQFLRPVEWNGGIMKFIKTPNPQLLTEAFQLLLECPLRYVLIYFSDDSSWAFRNDDNPSEVLRCNADIKSCDASQRKAIFWWYKRLFPYRLRREVRSVLKQCKLPLIVRNPSNSTQKVVLRPNGYQLYSGVGCTTSLNGAAMTNIGACVSERRITSTLDIARAAEDCGYMLTGPEVPLVYHEQYQFLKHSPMLAHDGKYYAVLNFGVLLRASGMAFGDLPGRGDLSLRALSFQRGLLRGAYPRIKFRLLDAMWEAVGRGPYSQRAFDFFRDKRDGDDFDVRIVDESFIRRYDLTYPEFDYLYDLLRNFGVGYSLNCTAIHKILMLDYELASSEEWDFLPPFFNSSRY